jgi:predicted PurR-regulated permease PerM
MPTIDSTPRSIARIVLIVVTVLLTLYVLYLLRRPLSWLIIAAFIAIAAAGPVNFFQRYMKRGIAIALVYLILILIPFGLGALLVPPLVGEIEQVAANAPEYVQDIEDYVQKNDTLNNLNEDYDIVSKLQEEAQKLPERIPDAAGVLSDIGVGLVNSIFAAVSILILSIFMVAGGPRWVSSFVAMQRPEHAERIERTLRRIANAVGNYVGGALVQATIAGVAAYVMLKILGAPFAGPLAVLIIWVIFAIVYQQVENYLIQPQIQKRATAIEPFVILVAVLCGSTLFGVIGALLAIPIAASIQIALHEWAEYRREVEAAQAEAGGPTPAPETGPTPAPGSP